MRSVQTPCQLRMYCRSVLSGKPATVLAECDFYSGLVALPCLFRLLNGDVAETVSGVTAVAVTSKLPIMFVIISVATDAIRRGFQFAAGA